MLSSPFPGVPGPYPAPGLPARAAAATTLDLLGTPALRDSAWTWFRAVQTRDQQYVSLLRDSDLPPIDMNADRMARYRPLLARFYYDPSRFRTYLEQLGIPYPMVQP